MSLENQIIEVAGPLKSTFCYLKSEDLKKLVIFPLAEFQDDTHMATVCSTLKPEKDLAFTKFQKGQRTFYVECLPHERVYCRTLLYA